jgi:hypothetical protein
MAAIAAWNCANNAPVCVPYCILSFVSTLVIHARIGAESVGRIPTANAEAGISTKLKSRNSALREREKW